MKRVSAITPLCGVVFLWFAITASPLRTAAQTTVENRITRAIDNSDRAALKGTLHAFARPEFDLGPVAGGVKLKGVSLYFKPSGSQQAALNKLLEQQQTPGSPKYHKWLTPEQYAARFGMSDGDLNKVTSWLESQGFTGITVSRSHTRVSFDGTAALVQAAFRTQLHHYLVNNETHFSMAAEPSLPRAISATVLGVRNLDDFRPRPRVRKLSNSDLEARPSFTSHVSGNHYLAPGDFATIYDLQSLYNAGLDGSGVTIAVVGQTAITPADIASFRSAAGLPASTPTLTLVTNSGTSTHVTDDEVEADLDVEWSGGVAPGANVNFVYTGNNSSFNVWDALQFSIDNNLAPVISTSYGFCESGLGSANVQVIQGWAQQANSQGQTISAASGDDGAADCDTGASGTQGMAVDVPASIPEVTGVGGTEFTGDCVGTACSNNSGANPPYWSGATGTDTLSSALEYIPELAWNDTAASVAAGGNLSATGGGVSSIKCGSVLCFPKPTWQTGVTPNDGARDVPDISLSASANHDGYLVCSQPYYANATTATTSCATAGSFRDSQGNLAVVGGTSVSSQIFGGILAILDQATNPGGLGNINQPLYTLHSTNSAAFHDITTGNNIVPCTSGSTGCPASAPFQYGFSAGTGYDQVTGLGTLNVNTMITSWPGFAPAPNFGLSGPSVTIASAGKSGTSTITITPSFGFTGTVNLSCALTPASSTAEIACSIASSVDITSGSNTAVLTVNTTAAHAAVSPSASMRTHRRFPWLPAGGGLGFAGIVLLGVPSRRRKHAILALVAFAFVGVWMGCGGGSSSSGSNTTRPGTPTGSYIIAVAGTNGNTSHTTNVVVTVQ